MLTIEPTISALTKSYDHETMSATKFQRYIGAGRDAASIDFIFALSALYAGVEYMNSPAGLIILAHQADRWGQVDGIHPACLSSSIEKPGNIIEPFRCRPVETAYNMHWMGRRSQGALVLEAFGRMIHGDDPEAPNLKTNSRFSLKFYASAFGLIVGIFERGTKAVHVIKPASFDLDTMTARGR